MTKQPAPSAPINPHQVSQTILDYQVTRIYDAEYSQFIPVSAQDVERHKQVQRAYARFFKRKQQIEETAKQNAVLPETVSVPSTEFHTGFNIQPEEKNT